MTKEDLQKKWNREFIDDDREILELISEGYEIYQRFVTPMATWLQRGSEHHHPNITGAKFRRFKKDGYIDHARDEKPHFAIYEISKHGVKMLETFRRKEAASAAEAAKPEPVEEEAVVVERLASAGMLQTTVAAEKLKETIAKANIIRTNAGGYILTVEFDDYPMLLKTTALLGLQAEHATEVTDQKPAGKQPKVKGERAVRTHAPREKVYTNTCDFCKEEYKLARPPKATAWLYHCDQKACKNAYGRHHYLFVIACGRNPTHADRQTSIPSSNT